MNLKKFLPKPIYRRLAFDYKIIKIDKNKVKYFFNQKNDVSADKYECPCCGATINGFISLNFEKRTNFFNPERYSGKKQEVNCPVCCALPRHRILATWFNEHKKQLNGKILYFAVENGVLYWLHKNKIKFKTADLFNTADLQLDIADTHQPDESWDWVICNHVLEHVDDYRKALKEIYRILKPGGTLICSFPILESLDTLIEETEHTEENKKKRLQLYGQADHLRIFGRDSDEILRKAGFEVSRIDGNTMPDKIYPVIGPADYDVNYLFVCRKPM